MFTSQGAQLVLRNLLCLSVAGALGVLCIIGVGVWFIALCAIAVVALVISLWTSRALDEWVKKLTR
jgi:uncharacterized membrane protein